MFRIEGLEFFPASICTGSDGNNSFRGSPFQLSKPRWISDEEVIFCALCKNKFNQLRRRHHCRCCGKVFCNKCCTEKLPLPQYALENPERVCNECIPVASCVAMSYSNDVTFHLRAVTELSTLCRDHPSFVVALGGAHMLIYLVKKKSSQQLQTVVHIANGLHSLSRHESLVFWLAEIGILPAICHMLNLGIEDSSRSYLSVITDALSSLRIIAKTSDKLKVSAFDTGCFPVLLTLCDHQDSGIMLVATTTLCLLAECRQNHNVIINQRNALRTLLMKVSNSVDEQVTEHVLRFLVVLSSGDDNVKHIIITEDAACGGVLTKVLLSKPRNMQITANAGGAIANLATHKQDQMLLHSILQAVLSSLKSSYPEYVVVPLIRATANFSAHEVHVSTLLTNFDRVIEFLNNGGAIVNLHVLRYVFNLLQYRGKETVKALSRNGVTDFLTRFSEIPDALSQVIEFLKNAAHPIVS